jgi:glycosyltransferase involved in cell wall biosynthesis
MKIAIAAVITKKITPHPLGGTEQFTCLLVNGLVKRGHHVTLYCAKGSETNAQKQIEFCEASEAMGEMSNVEFVYPYTLLEVREILNDIEKEKYDLLHVNFLKTFFISFFANKIRIPVLHTIHRDFFAQEKIYAIYKRIGFHENEHFAFVSQKAKELSLLKKHTHVVYNGIDIEKYPFSQETQDGYLWLSRVDPLKGPKEALLAAKKSGIKLTLSGEVDRGKYQEYFNLEIQPLLDKMRIFIAPAHELKTKISLYQQAKAFIFPIQWEEPFGLVVVEALSCGTPVITFDRGAMAEIIENGKTGYVVPREEGIPGIVKAIKKMESLSKEEYANMRNASRQRVEKLFTVEKMIDGYEALYNSILSSKFVSTQES